MDTMTKLQNFVFRGMLLSTTLGDLGEQGIDIGESSPTPSAEHQLSLEDFSITIRANAIRMSRIYTAFFCFENAVRELVEQRLLERLGSDWWEKAVSGRVKKKVEDRKNKDAHNKWHAPRGPSNVAYMDFGDLSDVITANWAHFEDLFPSQDWITTRIGDLEMSRNVIAHNNILSERDIIRIESHVGDWVRQVG